MARKTFESALHRLETITQELEQGELSLEQSLKKFDEGMALVDFCSKKLDEARARVDMLLNQDEEEKMPFPADQSGDFSSSVDS